MLETVKVLGAGCCTNILPGNWLALDKRAVFEMNNSESHVAPACVYFYVMCTGRLSKRSFCLYNIASYLLRSFLCHLGSVLGGRN